LPPTPAAHAGSGGCAAAAGGSGSAAAAAAKSLPLPLLPLQKASGSCYDSQLEERHCCDAQEMEERPERSTVCSVDRPERPGEHPAHLCTGGESVPH